MNISGSEKYLEALRRQGCIFHGSSKLINEAIEPRKAVCKAKLSGNRLAVYLTQLPVEAIFYGLTGSCEVGLCNSGFTYGIDTSGNLTYEQVALNVEFPEKVSSTGFVYVFSKDQSDEYINGEYLSYKAISPQEIVPVYREDLRYVIGSEV